MAIDRLVRRIPGWVATMRENLGATTKAHATPVIKREPPLFLAAFLNRLPAAPDEATRHWAAAVRTDLARLASPLTLYELPDDPAAVAEAQRAGRPALFLEQAFAPIARALLEKMDLSTGGGKRTRTVQDAFCCSDKV